MDQSLVLKLRSDLGVKEREAFIEQIGDWEEVRSAGPLFPTNKDRGLANMCFVRLAEGADAEGVLERLRHNPSIEKADISAKRGLT